MFIYVVIFNVHVVKSDSECNATLACQNQNKIGRLPYVFSYGKRKMV